MPELLVGEAVHFYGKIRLMVVRLEEALKKGDRIHIVGRKTEMVQVVTSMEIDHEQVESAEAGAEVEGRVHHGDRVFRIAAAEQGELPRTA